MTIEQIEQLRRQFKTTIDAMAQKIAEREGCSKQEVLNVLVHQSVAVLVDLVKEASHAAQD